MSSSWYTNKRRVLAESSLTKVEYPGRIVNPTPLLPAQNCSPNFSIFTYVKPVCNLKRCLPKK